MKKVIFTIALAIALTGCKKSDFEIEIERLEHDTEMIKNRQAKIEYLKELIEIREDIQVDESRKLADSLINDAKMQLNYDSN